MEMLDTVIGKISQTFKIIAAVWMFFLSIMILVDVLARGVISAPILGVPELIANSVVAIAFLQLPYTVRVRAMLRAEVVARIFRKNGQRTLMVFGLLTGAAFFALIAWAGWTPMVQSLLTGEYEGEGGLRVPVYPVRTLVVICSFLAAINYVLAARGELLGNPASHRGANH